MKNPLTFLKNQDSRTITIEDFILMMYMQKQSSFLCVSLLFTSHSSSATAFPSESKSMP